MKKDTRATLKIPQEMMKKIKAAAQKNNRKILDEIRERFKV